MVCILQNKNKQEVTGPGPPSLHSSLQCKFEKNEVCSHQKVFLQTLESDQSERNKRQLVLAGKMPKGHHIVGLDEKLEIKHTQFGEKAALEPLMMNVADRWPADIFETWGGEEGFLLSSLFSGGGGGLTKVATFRVLREADDL
jgi:hypothetical protein